MIIFRLIAPLFFLSLAGCSTPLLLNDLPSDLPHAVVLDIEESCQGFQARTCALIAEVKITAYRQRKAQQSRATPSVQSVCEEQRVREKGGCIRIKME